VRCPNCAAEISALRDVCPHCGASTDRAFDEPLRPRERGRSPEELSRNRKTALWIGGGILLLVAVMGQVRPFGRHLHLSPGAIQIDTRSEPQGPVTIGAEQLYQAYRDDPDAAAKRFGGREMVVSGEFLRIVPDGWGSLDLRLKTSNPDKPLGIDVAQLALDDAKKLRPGQMVTVSCQHMGSGGDVLWVQDCAIQSPGPADAQPPTPTPPAPPTAPPTSPESR
jgi:hypothetical protein